MSDENTIDCRELAREVMLRHRQQYQPRRVQQCVDEPIAGSIIPSNLSKKEVENVFKIGDAWVQRPKRNVRPCKVMCLSAAFKSNNPNTRHSWQLPNGGEAGTSTREMELEEVFRGLVATLMREVNEQHKSNRRAKERREKGKPAVEIHEEPQDAQVEGPLDIMPAIPITQAIPMDVEPSNAAGKQPDPPPQQRPQTSAEGGSGGGCSSKSAPTDAQPPEAPPRNRTPAPSKPAPTLSQHPVASSSKRQRVTGAPPPPPRTVRQKVEDGMLAHEALGLWLG